MSNVHSHPSDETLMAYVDGELEEAAAAAVERALLADPALAPRLVGFIQSRRLARAELAAAAVPAALQHAVAQLIGEAGQAREAARRVMPFRAPGRRLALGAMAAMLLASAGALGYLAGLPSGAASALARLDAPDVVRELARAPAGSRRAVRDGEVRPLATYRLAGGALCRDYVVTYRGDAAEGVICREGADWRAVAGLGRAAGPGYAPADGESVIDRYLGEIGAGEPLSRVEEAALLSAGD